MLSETHFIIRSANAVMKSSIVCLGTFVDLLVSGRGTSHSLESAM